MQIRTPQETSPLTAQAVSARFSPLPDLSEVIQQLFERALAEQYPTLEIDLSQTSLFIPQARSQYTIRPLMDVVHEYLSNGSPLSFSDVDGHAHYLSTRPPSRLRLPGPTSENLDMQVIEALIKELPATLPVALQNALLTYWNEPATGRWQWLSDVLQDSLRISAIRQTELEAWHRETVDQLVTTPEREQRVARDGEQAMRALCLETTLTYATQSVTLLEPAMVLARPANGISPVLLCQPGGRIEVFLSMDALLKTWGERLGAQYMAQEIVTRRYEPDGNIFDHQAALIFNRQQENLGALCLPTDQGFAALQALYQAIADPGQYLLDTPDIAPERLATLRPLLPDWMQQASAQDQFTYRRLCLALASAKQRGQGRTFLSDIKDIHTFAADALLQALQHDAVKFHTAPPALPPVVALHPNDLELTFTIAAGYPGTAGIITHKKMSLTALAIHNLMSIPSGQLRITHRLGTPLPTWLTPDYIKGAGGLIERVDIGKNYPLMLDEQLLKDIPQAQAREVLFADQLSLYLPLLALELSLKREHGLTPTGARMVEAVMQREVADQFVDHRSIVIRHLSLVRAPGAPPDPVSNLYIIEGQDNATGPHILYRPLYRNPLQEFTSRSAVLEAIAQPGELQTSVLTWLHDNARPVYENGGFKQPHILHFLPGDEFTDIHTPAPAQLATNGDHSELRQCLMTGCLMQYLYGENVRALIAQADRESVSNRESRWQVFLEGGSLLFSIVLLPLFRGPTMLTGWFLSLNAAISSDVQALSSNDPKAEEMASIDLLLNLGLMLLEGVPGTRQAHWKVKPVSDERALPPILPHRVIEQWPSPTPPRIREAGASLPGVLPNSPSAVLDFSFSQARQRLTARQRASLASFSTPAPTPAPVPVLRGPRKGLYLVNDRWYAQIDTHWFQVTLEPEGEVVIHDPVAPQRRGPPLRPDANGAWSVDTRLRLRGGMPPTRIAAERQRRTQRVRQLEAEYNQFISGQTARQKTIDITQSVMEKAELDERYSQAQRASTRQRFDTELRQQTADYQQLLESMKERDELAIPLAPRTVAALMENTVNNARKHVVLAEKDRAALYAANKDFTVEGATLKLAVIRDPLGYERFVKDSIAINDRLIQWLELKDRYLDELLNLGPETSEGLARLTRDRPANELSALAIKDLQIRNLSLMVVKQSAHPLFDTFNNIFTELKVHVRTHSELIALELTSSDRTRVLESLVEHYGRSLDALQGIGIVNVDELEGSYFTQLTMRIDELYKGAVQQLADEVKPVAQPRRRAPRRKLITPGRPTKKVIRTPNRGTLIGNVTSIGTLETVEVRSEVNDEVLGTYAQRGDEWVPFTDVIPPKPPAAARGLSLVKGETRSLLSKLDAHLRRGEDYSKVCRHPQELQEVLHHEATHYDRLATELDQAIQSLPENARTSADLKLVSDMRQAAVRLTTKGDELRIQLSLQLPPTHGNLEYLLSQKRVGIALYGERTAMKGERQDFIQEYAITDLKGHPLWYAHFHYEHADTPKAHYGVAHLKTRQQRRQSYYSLLAKAQSSQAVVDVHRGVIGKALADRWFLPLAP